MPCAQGVLACSLACCHLCVAAVPVFGGALLQMFWQPDCLAFTYHDLDPAAGIATMPPLRKTFREKSSYFAALLPMWR